MLVVYVDDFKLAGPSENMDKAWASIRQAVNIGEPEPYDRYFGCQHVEFNGVKLPSKAHPFAHVFDSQTAAAAQTQHRTNDFWQHDPVKKTWTRYHLQPRKKLFEPGDEGGEFAKFLHHERVTMCDKKVEFKGLPILNTHLYDEESTIIEDDMTVDQKVQTVDFWTGRTIFKYGESSGNSDQFALPSKNRPGPHRDKREAKNDKKAQRFRSIESVTDRKGGCMTKPVNLVRYDMSSFLESCVDAYCELAKVRKDQLPTVATPFTEAGIARPTLDDKETPGRLQPIASKVLMKILFAARMARPDLLRATQSLASRVTKWSIECDIALHRLVAYVHSSTKVFMEGFVGDSFDDCQLWLFADADHAGEFDSKSTSGCAMFLVGPNTYFPLNAFSKKQTVVANSSTEAEVVSANHALRAEGIPMLALMEQLGIFKKLAQKAGVKAKPGDPEPEDPVFTRIDKEIDEIRYGNVEGGLSASNINSLKAHFPEFYKVKFMEDNQASITVMGTGNSSTMRYANKTQNICFKWMKQQFENEQFDLINVGTLWQTADILTKPFTSPTKWEHALRLMNIGPSWIGADGKVRHLDSRPACVANASHQGGQDDSRKFQRLLIEFCCSADSKLSTPRDASKGCKLIRVTESEDGSSLSCRNWLAQEVKDFRKANPQGAILLYASLPCVGGSPWGSVNSLTESGAERIEQQQKDFSKLFKSFQKLIQEIDGPQLSIAFELSKNCKYWKWPMVQAFLKRYQLTPYPFHGCQFGVQDLHGLPMKKGWMIATNMEELSVLSEHVCDGSHTHGQSRGVALKLAENYTFALTDLIHDCFRSRASTAQTAPKRRVLAFPAMASRTIGERQTERAMKSAGLTSVPQQSNMTEWLAFRRYLDEQGDQHCGWEDIFQTILGAATVNGQGAKPEDLEMASGLIQCFTAQSMATDALMSVPWAKDLMQLSRVSLDSLWDFPLPQEYIPGTSRPTVDVVPTLYVITSDSALALITGRGRTLKKYTIEKDLEARKAGCILEIGHEMLWGKDLQALVKANIAKVKELLEKYRERYGSSIRVISIVLWSGNELCSQHGIEPLDMWGQRDPQGYWPHLMERVKGNMVWWNKQLLDLGVDQAALIGEPDPLVYELGKTFTMFLDRFKEWFHAEIAKDNDRIRWIENNKLPARLELKDLFHAFESEENRAEMIGYVMSTFQLLHVMDILRPQIAKSDFAILRAEGDATFHDTAPRAEELPVACQQLLRLMQEKVNRPAAAIVEPQSFTKEELDAFPADRQDGPPDEAEGNPWDDVDVNEHEGPSVGKAKASRPPVEAAPAAKAASSADVPKAALIGAPPQENAEMGTVVPEHARGHVTSYRYTMEENVRGEVVEHVVIDAHPYELITKTCWEIEGAKELPWPWRLHKHTTKINAVTRGQPGRSVNAFDSEMWLDLEVFFKEYNLMLPKNCREPTVSELLALVAHDNKCRFEFKCVAGLQLATRKGLAYWPFKIRAVQGHSEKAVQKAAASDTFNATLVYAGGGTVALSKVSLTGKPLAPVEETPGVIYHRTTRGSWKGILQDGFIPGGGDRISSGRAHNYFADKQVGDKEYVSGVRAQRPIEIRVAMREAVTAGLVFIRTTSDGILTKDVVPPQFILSIEDVDNKSNLYVRKEAVEKVAKATGATTSVKERIAAFEGRANPRAQTGEVASSSKDTPVVFPGKVKPPPPIALPKPPGYAHSRAVASPPPKAEAPKASPRTEAEKAKTPRPPSTPPPKVESPRPALPKAKAEPPKPVAKATTEEPAQKKAALIGVPASVPAAKPPVAPPAAAKLLEASAKVPKKETTSAEASATTAPKSHGAGSTPKSLGKETTPKQPPETPTPVAAVKLETSTCPRCFAQTFQGQIQCNVCGETLEDASKGQRARIAERRREALQKLGVRYDFKGEFLKKVTNQQLEGMGLLGDHLRGSISPEADLIARAKARYTTATKKGYDVVLDRFSKDAVFAASLLNEGENEYDCERYDLLRHAHLPKTERTKAQVQLGVSEQSQQEHLATRLVYLDVRDQRDVPDRFHYIGQSWLFMYRTEIYSQDEYIDFLQRNPTDNLLLTSKGTVEVDVSQAERHLAYIKNENRDLYRKQIEDKRIQSERAKAQQEVKRKAEQASAYGQGPSKRGTVSSVAQQQQPDPGTTSAGTSGRQEQASSSSSGRVETGEWQKWHGRWYQKVIRYGRNEWEPW